MKRYFSAVGSALNFSDIMRKIDLKIPKSLIVGLFSFFGLVGGNQFFMKIFERFQKILNQTTKSSSLRKNISSMNPIMNPILRLSYHIETNFVVSSFCIQNGNAINARHFQSLKICFGSTEQ